MNFTPSFIKTKEKLGDPIASVRYAPAVRYMCADCFTFQDDQKIDEVIDIMIRGKISGAPVVNINKELVGMISEKDLIKVLIDDGYYNNPLNDRMVKDYMSTDVHTVQLDTDLINVAKLFIASNFRRYPVVDADGKLVGQITRKDVLKAARKLHSTTWH